VSPLHNWRPLVLVGFMASGKSTIGARLAHRLKLPFVDSDVVIEGAAGMSIGEIFRTRGERYFREMERQTILSLLDMTQVIAAGGGAFVDSTTREKLREQALTIWLDPGFEILTSRLSRSSKRPLASNKSNDELRDLWLDRRSFYMHADLHIQPSHDDPDVTVAEIIESLPADYPHQ